MGGSEVSMPVHYSPAVGTAARVAAGLALIVHGLAHAVFASRGSAAALPTFGGAYAMLVCYSLALVAFTVAGVGMLGSRVFRSARHPALVAGLSCSLIALALGWDGDLWPGLAGNVAVAWYLLRRRGEAWPPAPAAPRSPRHWWRRAGRVAGEGVAVLFVVYIAAGAILWPWHRSWGTTDADWAMTLPDDPPVREPATELMHAIAIDAPDYVVWAWLAQIGQDRAGFYSYDSLERLFGVAIVNAEAIHPEWQRRAVGELLPATQPGYLGVFDAPLGWKVTAIEPCRALVLEQWGVFAVLPEGPARSRLVIRSRVGDPHAPVWAAALSFTLFEIPHFIMERGMLRGIKARAESAHGRDGAAPCDRAITAS